MSIRRLTSTTLASLCVLAGLLALAGASARAFTVHNYVPGAVPQLGAGVPTVGPHGEAVPLPGPLSLNASSMTIDSGHLWIAEAAGILGNGNVVFRIDEFDASTGAFISQLAHSEVTPRYGGSGIAVGHASGEAVTYVGEGIGPGGEAPAVAAFDEAGAQKTWSGAGTPAGSFGPFASGFDIAVDDASSPLDEYQGDVYVSDAPQGVIDIFHPEADGEEHYVGQITAGRIAGFPAGETFRPGHLAVSEANGDVIVENGAAYDILEPAALGGYTLAGEITGTPSGPLNPVNVAVDGASGEIYVIDGYGPAFVDQFSPTGAYLGRITGADTPSGKIGGAFSLAIEPSSQDVYVGDTQVRTGAAMDVFGPDVIRPDVATGSASNVGPTSATLNGTVNPDKAGAATCRFEWGTSKSFGEVAPCEPEAVAEGGSPVPVHATLSGLAPDTSYDYRLQASNQNGINPGEPVQDAEFTTPGPGIHHESVANVAATSATMQATIDPHTASTTYYFQYGTTSGYGVDVPLLSSGSPRGQSIGSGAGDVEVAQHLQGLQVNTAYHYRVVAISELAPGQYEEFDGPDQTFTTQKLGGELALADNRAWEMVSPPEKFGAKLEPISEQAGEIRAASSGDALTYVANTPVETEPQGFASKVQELSTRGPAGWAPVTITVPHIAATGQPVGYGPEYRSFSDDLSQAAIQPIGVFNPSLSVEASEQTAFLHATYLHGDVTDPCTSSCYHPLATGAAGYANVPPGTIFGEQGEGKCLIGCGPNFVGATPDMSHVVLSSKVGLTSGPGGGGGLYEWSAGSLAFIGKGQVGNPGAQGDGHSISDDGSRIVITGAAAGLEGLLMRDMTSGETVKLDAVQGGSGANRESGALFQAASSDGARVFFIDRQKLTKDAGEFGNEAHLYECEMVSEAGKLACKLTDLTPVSSSEPASVQGSVLGVSEDGSWVYFATRGRLGSEGGSGINLYMLRFDGTSWENPRFIATLSEEDSNDWSEHISAQPTRVSPDGRWLEFMSQASLTGYDNRDAVNGRPDAEVYLYDASTGRLSCASCDPTGARPIGREYHSLEPGEGGLVGGPAGIWQPSGWVAANVPGWQHTNIGEEVEDYQSRYLSDAGRLFFNTDDALVPQDVNGTEDVYEFEPPGVGACSTASATFSERSDGCVGLVSSGTSPTESGFLDASEGGGDVFFITGERLAPQDFDTSLDIYDAHECSAQAPCASVVSLPPACSTGDACKPAPTPQPASFGAPASATFSGAGNITPPTGGGAAPRSLSGAQKLARALKACRKKDRKQRAVCERKARRRYAAKRSRKANRTKGKKG